MSCPLPVTHVLSPDLERAEDHFEDCGQLTKDEIRRKAEHRDALPTKERRPPLVVAPPVLGEVLPPVELDGELPAGGIEVEDVRTAGMLSPKLEAGEASVPQVKPERGLGVGAVHAERTATSKGEVHVTVFGITPPELPTLVLPARPSP